MTLPAVVQGRLSLPVIGSPMFIVSGPELVIAQCKAGIVGSFPALNARPAEVLEQWLQRITTELAWQVLENYAEQSSAPNVDRIVSFVCKTYGIEEPELRSKSRSQQTVLARNTAFYLCRKHTDLSLAAIGERLGRKHSTVLKGITNLEREMSLQTPLGRQMAATLDRLTA